MDQTLLLSIVTTGFLVAFLHAAIPTHWLPFALAARGQGWSHGKTLGVTALAGAGHALFTAGLGILVVGLGIVVDQWTGNVFPFIAGGILIAFGLYYVVRHFRGGGHGHNHGGDAHHDGHGDHKADHGHRHGNDHADGHAHDHSPGQIATTARRRGGRRSDRGAALSLIALLTFSPCEGFLPIYLSGIAYGWAGFLLLSAVLTVATLAGMVLFTWITLVGLKQFNLEALDRYEHFILGGVLCFLGVLVMVFES